MRGAISIMNARPSFHLVSRQVLGCLSALCHHSRLQSNTWTRVFFGASPKSSHLSSTVGAIIGSLRPSFQRVKWARLCHMQLATCLTSRRRMQASGASADVIAYVADVRAFSPGFAQVRQEIFRFVSKGHKSQRHVGKTTRLHQPSRTHAPHAPHARDRSAPGGFGGLGCRTSRWWSVFFGVDTRFLVGR